MKLRVKDMSKIILLILIILLGSSAVCFCEEVTLTTILPSSAAGSANVKVASGTYTSSAPVDAPSPAIDLSVAPYNFNPAKPWHVIVGGLRARTDGHVYGIYAYSTKSADNKSFTVTAWTDYSYWGKLSATVDWLAIQVQ